MSQFPHPSRLHLTPTVEASLQSTSRRRYGNAARPRWSSRLLARWHLLSFDAPSVAALWMGFIALAFGFRLPWTDIAAMFAAVWMLYSADRMLDARVLDRDPRASGLEARHLYHHLYGDTFRWGMVVGFVLLLFLLPRMVQPELTLYLALAALLAAWFGLIHRSSRILPKEIAVGVFFAVATTLPTALRLHRAWAEPIVPALFFAFLCSLNCLFIGAWETENGSCAKCHITARLAYRFLPQLTLIAAGAALLAMPFAPPAARWILVACALAMGLLLMLHLLRHRIATTSLRALADAALLTPLLLLPALLAPRLARMWVR